MEDIEQTHKEKTRLYNGLAVLVLRCSTLQDLRDALPDSVVSLFPELASLSRFREPGWPFEDKPLQAHDYRATEELLGFYVTNRLLY